MSESPRWEELREAFQRYARGRQELLEAIGVDGSNRDPLSEFSERLAAALLDGELASNRVQRGWDLTTTARRRVQVKYLANPAEEWINGIAITFGPGEDEPDDFAIVFFEALLPVSVMVFPRERLGAICTRLRKRHPNQENSLQLTRANFRQLLTDRDAFAALGVRVFDLRVEAAAADAAATVSAG